MAKLIGGEKTPFQVAHSLFTPALGTENLAQVLSNTDFFKASTGRDARIVKPGRDVATQAGEMGHWLAGRTLPGQMAQTDKFSPGTLAYRLAGITFPKTKRELHGTPSWSKFRRALDSGR
jgi:hypothetical protein